MALALIRASGVPIAAPSANVSGRPSGTTGEHVFDDLQGKIDLVLDAGPVEIGLESTVLDVSTLPPSILRHGAVTKEQLESVIGEVALGRQSGLLKRSPGTWHRHYSPTARVTLVRESDKESVRRLIEEGVKGGRRLGVMTCRPDLYQAMPPELDEYASLMFAVIRELDGLGVDEIVVGEVREEGIGVAVMDRLRRAASSR